MDMIKFCLSSALAPMFELDRALVGRPLPAGAKSGAEEQSESEEAGGQQRQGAAAGQPSDAGDATLDLEGPPLIEGLTSWLFFYRLFGHINLPRVPLYVALAYKLCVGLLISFVFYRRFLMPIVVARILNPASMGAGHNPVFMTLGLLMVAVEGLTAVEVFYTNLFKLSPLFNLLTTRKLCFIKRRTQALFGDDTLGYMLALNAYWTLLIRSQASDSFGDFVENFELTSYLVEFVTLLACVFYTLGRVQLDLYVRLCFSAWLLALKCNFEYRAARFDRLRAQMRRECALAREHSECSLINEQQRENDNQRTLLGVHKLDEAEEQRELVRVFKQQYAFITLDEVQKSLNTMDDYLEVCRGVDSRTLILIALHAFLITGVLILIAYNMCANNHDLFHSCGMLLIALTHALLVSASYFGDSFLRYSLASFVQTVEDEHFLQAPSDCAAAAVARPSCLAIERAEVMFCRELLHQFETHLATPWSKLTFKSQMGMFISFVELIAAQIMFDREHR